MYFSILVLHNLTRWLVLGAGLAAVIRAGWGLKTGRSGAIDRILPVAFAHSLTLQLLLGFTLFALPESIGSTIMQNPDLALGTPGIRFFVLNHTVLMMVAVGLAHFGLSRIRQEGTLRGQSRQALLWFTAALLVILSAVPWSFLAGNSRPWIRFW